MDTNRVDTNNHQHKQLNIRRKVTKAKLLKLTPGRILILGFLSLILIGGILLVLPFSSNNGISIGFTDALFTSVSAVCVTGLVVADTNLQWSFFGKAVILILIQIGALGIMSVVTLFSIFTGRQLGLMDRLTLQEATNNFSLAGIARTFKGILAMTLVIETLGAVCIAFELVPVYGIAAGIRKSIFHSVSAFCNAGFDIFGTDTNPFPSLTFYQDRPFFLMVTSLLIIIGGLGFIVWQDIAAKRRFSRFTLHSKLVLITTLVLLGAGTLLFFLSEFRNPNTLSGLSFSAQWVNAFFQSVTTRTAGFNALPIGEMTEASNFLTILLMFIGGASASTAGGIKVTTICVILLAIRSFVKGKKDVEVFDKRIPDRIIMKAIAVVVLSSVMVILTTMILLFNQEGGLLQALYEATSAFGTVGLTTGITPELNTVSKVMLMLTMFLGRVGPFAAVIALTLQYDKRNLTYRYPEGEVTVG